jgi:hypothetical protein
MKSGNRGIQIEASHHILSLPEDTLDAALDSTIATKNNTAIQNATRAFGAFPELLQDKVKAAFEAAKAKN